MEDEEIKSDIKVYSGSSADLHAYRDEKLSKRVEELQKNNTDLKRLADDWKDIAESRKGIIERLTDQLAKLEKQVADDKNDSSESLLSTQDDDFCDEVPDDLLCDTTEEGEIPENTPKSRTPVCKHKLREKTLEERCGHKKRDIAFSIPVLKLNAPSRRGRIYYDIDLPRVVPVLCNIGDYSDFTPDCECYGEYQIGVAYPTRDGDIVRAAIEIDLDALKKNNDYYKTTFIGYVIPVSEGTTTRSGQLEVVTSARLKSLVLNNNSDQDTFNTYVKIDTSAGIAEIMDISTGEPKDESLKVDSSKTKDRVRGDSEFCQNRDIIAKTTFFSDLVGRLGYLQRWMHSAEKRQLEIVAKTDESSKYEAARIYKTCQCIRELMDAVVEWIDHEKEK